MEAESLSAACELAFSVAREGVEATPPVDPPTPMRSFLYVAQLPKRAMTVAQRVIDEDPEFRVKVAQAASAESVGEVGYLWLSRPENWEADIEALEVGEPEVEVVDEEQDSPPPPPLPPASAMEEPIKTGPRPAPPVAPHITSSDTIQEELSSLQGIVTKLSAERQQVSSEVAGVEPSRGEGGISAQIDLLRQDLASIRAERDRAQEQKELSIVHQAELADEIAELRRLIGSLEEERAGIQATLAQAEEQVVSVQVIVSDLETQRDSVIVERDTVIDERDELTIRRDELIAQTEALQAERENLTAEVSDLTGQRDSLTVERNGLLSQRDELTVQLADAGSNAQALESHITDISSQASTLQSDFTTLKAERAAVDAELERINSDLSATAATRRVMVDSLGSQLSEVKSERDVLAGQLAQSQQNLAALRGVFSNLGSELDSADAVASEAVSTHTTLTGAIDSAAAGLESLSAADDPAAPNLALLDSQLGESAGALNLAGSTPPPPGPNDAPTAAPLGGPAYDAPAPPTLLDGGDEEPEADESDEGGIESTSDDSSSDELDEVSDEIAAELGTTETQAVAGRQAIEIPDSIDPGSDAMALHVANTGDVVLLIQGDAAASMGWPSMTVAEQRNALVTYLSELAGDTGAAPDVMFDSGVGGEEDLPESRVVRMRLSQTSGSDCDEIADLISTYPEEWPIAVVTDDDVLAASASAAGATVLGNGQLLNLFT